MFFIKIKTPNCRWEFRNANIIASRRCLASGHRACSPRCEPALAYASRTAGGNFAPKGRRSWVIRSNRKPNGDAVGLSVVLTVRKCYPFKKHEMISINLVFGIFVDHDFYGNFFYVFIVITMFQILKNLQH